jgi:hypothetical protein
MNDDLPEAAIRVKQTAERAITSCAQSNCHTLIIGSPVVDLITRTLYGGQLGPHAEDCGPGKSVDPGARGMESL